MTTGLDVFDRTLQKTNLWLDELAADLMVDRHHAYRALRAVLHVLRDRLPPGTAVDLAAQLPMLVRGFYFEGWVPATTPTHIRHTDELLAQVCGRLEPECDPSYGEEVILAVLGLLDRHITEGELEAVKQCLPRELRRIWPQAEA
jgi:uncharacterized protein (DUF2267 family)